MNPAIVEVDTDTAPIPGWYDCMRILKLLGLEEDYKGSRLLY